MYNNAEQEFIELFGEDNLARFREKNGILDLRSDKLAQLYDLNKQAREVFCVNISLADIIVAAATGSLVGIGNSLFKTHVPQHGKYAHDHAVKRVGIDYKVAKPEGYKGSVQDLHRQIGPGHDIFRFKDALDLISGETNNFPLWGKMASDYAGGIMHPGNMGIKEFLSLGGFRIPDNPAYELASHLLIDFFTKRSLPIPGTSYIADCSPDLAEIMFYIYDKGFNLKTLLGNSFAFSLLQMIMLGYVFLFKAIPQSNFKFDYSSFDTMIQNLNNLQQEFSRYLKSNEFHVLQMIAHGSSFLFDTIITTSSKSYAGLLQLNYGSLLCLGKHSLQYILQSTNEYKIVFAQMKSTADCFYAIDNVWYDRFKTDFLLLANNNDFTSLFDSDELIKRHNRVATISKKIKNECEKSQIYIEALSDKED
jgi:hypothetical protein